MVVMVEIVQVITHGEEDGGVDGGGDVELE